MLVWFVIWLLLLLLFFSSFFVSFLFDANSSQNLFCRSSLASIWTVWSSFLSILLLYYVFSRLAKGDGMIAGKPAPPKHGAAAPAADTRIAPAAAPQGGGFDLNSTSSKVRLGFMLLFF
jgi:hypothetical protein